MGNENNYKLFSMWNAMAGTPQPKRIGAPPLLNRILPFLQFFYQSPFFLSGGDLKWDMVCPSCRTCPWEMGIWGDPGFKSIAAFMKNNIEEWYPRTFGAITEALFGRLVYFYLFIFFLFQNFFCLNMFFVFFFFWNRNT